MEKEKNGKGKNVVIVILLLFLLGLGGFIIYDKVLNNKTESYKTEIKQLKKENKTLEKENKDLKDKSSNSQTKKNNTNTPNTTSLVGKYSGRRINETCTYYASLNLITEDAYTYNSGCTCGGGIVADGKYTVETNNIHFYDENYGDFEIKYDNGVLITNQTCGGVEVKMEKQE